MNDTITIKPHHFMDIIKLYGSGIEVFVPDEKMRHDFYKIANAVIGNPNLCIHLTIEGDDICLPCKMYTGTCTDTISHIPGISSKNDYNKSLDARILEFFQLEKPEYTALELCQILYQSHEQIFRVWQEEEDQITKKRHRLFLQGAKKYLAKYTGNLSFIS